MNVVEIFKSIEGEGIRTGELSVFVRFSGCNLRCPYCDTKYAIEENSGKECKISDILDIIKGYNCKNITITGGEPLIHKNIDIFLARLSELNYNINVETNGTVNIYNFIHENIFFTVDYKTRSSGINFNKFESNIKSLRTQDILKCVVSRNDLSDIEHVIQINNNKCLIYISPVLGEIEPREIVEYMKFLQDKNIDMSKVRLQLQIHKYIWDKNTRCV